MLEFFGIFLLIVGIVNILSSAIYEGYPSLYTKEDIQYVKPPRFGSIISLLGIYLIGPSVIAGSIYLSIFPLCYFIGRKKKDVRK